MENTGQQDLIDNLNNSINILDQKMGNLQLGESVGGGMGNGGSAGGEELFSYDNFQTELDQLKAEIASEINNEVAKIIME